MTVFLFLRDDVSIRPCKCSSADGISAKVNAFFDFIRTIDLDDPLVSDKLRDAVRYALNQEENLRKFLDDGNIPLDNGASLSEQITYPYYFAVGIDTDALREEICA